jgi:hypothetical protein
MHQIDLQAFVAALTVRERAVATQGRRNALQRAGTQEFSWRDHSKSQTPNITFAGQLWERMTMLGVKLVERKGNPHWKALPLTGSFILLQVIHQCNEFRMAPKEKNLLPDVRERIIDDFEILVLFKHFSSQLHNAQS